MLVGFRKLPGGIVVAKLRLAVELDSLPDERVVGIQIFYAGI